MGFRIRLFCLTLSVFFLSGCLGSIWTGAKLIYDRHDVYKEVGDFQLAATASRALYKDQLLKCPACAIDLAVFNGDILLAGHVPTVALRQEAEKRIRVAGYRRLFFQIGISNLERDYVKDSWITAKIRSSILADADIDPDQFKIVTADRIVYLMGDVIPAQAKKVVEISRSCSGVRRVVKLLRYYHLTDHM